MDSTLFLKALVIGLSIAAPVGPIGLLCIQRTLAHGRGIGFLSGLGAALADAFYGAIGALGVLAGYRAVVPPRNVGYTVMALVGITTPQPEKVRLLKLLESRREVLECFHVTGQDSYVLKVAARDIEHLEAFVSSINHLGETRTSIVMSVPIPPRAVTAPNMEKQPRR